VNDLLDVERIEAGALVVTRQPTDVGALARIVIEAVDPAGHALHIAADPVVANLDAVQIERIIENLVANAIRHTPAGTDVWLTVGVQDSGVLIAVEDAGPGVPEDQREEIFRPFRRGGREGAPGVGIGLSLVAGFALLHGGRAWVEGRAGGGASFKVFIPDER
jgi:signal transduction histidine kinase